MRYLFIIPLAAGLLSPLATPVVAQDRTSREALESFERGYRMGRDDERWARARYGPDEDRNPDYRERTAQNPDYYECGPYNPYGSASCPSRAWPRR